MPITGTAMAKIDNQVMGRIEQRVFLVVYTQPQHATRIISARKGNLREVRHYENSTRKD